MSADFALIYDAADNAAIEIVAQFANQHRCTETEAAIALMRSFVTICVGVGGEDAFPVINAGVSDGMGHHTEAISSARH